MKTRRHGILTVNLAVFFFGMAGLFARWIHLPAIVITFGRVVFSAGALGLFMLIRRESIRVADTKDRGLLILSGITLALHWWSFLSSIQRSTVAVGTITFSSFPLFVTFLEPLFFHKKLTLRGVLTAFIILAGVFVTVPEFSLKNQYVTGIFSGLVSAFSYAVLTVMNKRFSVRYSGTLTAFYEQAAAALVLIPFVLGMKIQLSFADLGLLVCLGVVMTAVAHTLFISSLKWIPAYLAGICSAMETVYSIFFAWLFLKEIPSGREIIGGLIIITAVMAAQLYEAYADTKS